MNRAERVIVCARAGAHASILLAAALLAIGRKRGAHAPVVRGVA